MMTGRPAARSITMPEIQLARDRQALLDQQPRDHAPFGARLMRDQVHPVDLIGELVGLSGVRGELDAAALASATGVNLRFDDDRSATQPLRDGFCVRCVRTRPRPREPARRTSQEFVWLDTREFSYVEKQ